MGHRLFERSRTGYKAGELAQRLASHAEQIEAQLEAARSAAHMSADQASGSVRITSTDTILHGLVAAPLKLLRAKHPLLRFELHAGNELASLSRRNADTASRADWIAPDEALPEHPSVLWRKRHFPKVTPAFQVNSILMVAELIGQGMGVGRVPLFLAKGRSDLKQLNHALDECQTELWLLAHTETRHLRRVATVFTHLSQHMSVA